MPLYLDDWTIDIRPDESRNSDMAVVELIDHSGGLYTSETIVLYNVGRKDPDELFAARAMVLSYKMWVVRRRRFFLRWKISRILKRMELEA